MIFSMATSKISTNYEIDSPTKDKHLNLKLIDLTSPLKYARQSTGNANTRLHNIFFDSLFGILEFACLQHYLRNPETQALYTGRILQA